MGKSKVEKSKAQKAKKEEKQAAASAVEGKEKQMVAIVVGALAVLYAIVYQLQSSDGPVLLQADALRPVFTSGKPWLVWCRDIHSERAQALNKGSTDELLKEASVLLKHAKIDRKAQVGILDCMKQLPSGMNTVEKLSLNTSITPVMFVAANGNRPFQVTPEQQRPASNLAKYVGEKVIPMVYLPKSTDQLQRECLSRRWCAVVLMKGELLEPYKSRFPELKQKFRNVRFMKVDGKRLKLKLGYSNVMKKNTPELKAPSIILIHNDKKDEPKFHVQGYKGDLDADGGAGSFIEMALYASKDDTVVPATMETLDGSISLNYKKGKAPKKKDKKAMTPEERRKAYEKKKADKLKLTPEQRKAQDLRMKEIKKENEKKRREQMAKEEGEVVMEAADEDEETEDEGEAMGAADGETETETEGEDDVPEGDVVEMDD